MQSLFNINYKVQVAKNVVEIQFRKLRVLVVATLDKIHLEFATCYGEWNHMQLNIHKSGM